MGQGGEPHVQAEDIEQIGADCHLETVARIGDIPAYALCTILKGREVIAIVLEKVGDGVGCKVKRLGLPFGLRRRCTRSQHPVAVIQLDDCAGRSGISLGQVTDFEIGQVAIGENVVTKGFHQVSHQPSLVTIDQFTRFDAEIAGDGEQQRHGDLAPIVLDQVEIARGNAQRLGQIGLVETALAAQPFDPPTNLAIGHIRHVPLHCLYRIYKSCGKY